MSERDYSYEPEVHIVEGPADPYEFYLEWEYFAEVLVTDNPKDFLQTARELAQKCTDSHKFQEGNKVSRDSKTENKHAVKSGDKKESATDQLSKPASPKTTSSGRRSKKGKSKKGSAKEAESAKSKTESKEGHGTPEAETSPTEKEPSKKSTEDKSKISKLFELDAEDEASLTLEGKSWPPDYIINNRDLSKQVAEAAKKSLQSKIILTAANSKGNLDLTSDFIPVTQLTIESLPEDIRNGENLRLIQDVAKRVVRVRLPKTSEERRADDPLSEHILYGTGVVIMILGNVAVVATSKHILQDADEVKASTIDFFFDSETEWYKAITCSTGIGTLDMWKDNDDTTLALYILKNEAAAVLSEPGFHGLQSPGLSWPTLGSEEYSKAKEMKASGNKFAKPSEGKHTVCVISHPLGRSKHVTFGTVVSGEDAHDKELVHNTPTRYGSVGAPLLIFAHVKIAYDSVWYHLGQSLDGNGLKLARAQKINLQSMLEELQNPRKPKSERQSGHSQGFSSFFQPSGFSGFGRSGGLPGMRFEDLSDFL